MSPVCPVCGQLLVAGLRPWHFECRTCSYEGSNLEPHILEQAEGGDLDEGSRETGLAALRKANFERLATLLRGMMPTQGSSLQRLLDVGCAHGWFLEATARDFNGEGLEPDMAVADATAARGLPVRNGFFPDALRDDERFDVIVFNDVLEHIPDINGTMKACANRLNPGGLLVINAPSRRGALYRFSRVLARLGLAKSFERLWQLGFPSPHVHYLGTDTVRVLGQRHGFDLESRVALPSVSVQGLYARIRYSRDVPAFKAMALTTAIAIAKPVLAVLPSDIEVWFLRRGT